MCGIELSAWAALILTMCVTAVAQAGTAVQSREEAIALMRPYDGGHTKGVDTGTLTGKIMAGYQGWFTAEGDGSGRGWRHYSRRGEFKPGQCNIDLWPDMRELDEDEKYATPFRLADGFAAPVFSSHNRKTVLRHFRWMREYGIDGVFVQRFAVETRLGPDLHHCNTVLASCREGANAFGRTYAVMYDLSGLKAGQVQYVIEDWKLLVDKLQIGKRGEAGKDGAYLHHGSKPVVAVWGIGFKDRPYTLDECGKLIEFLKNDARYGGNTVMLGLPMGWRTLDRDSTADAALHKLVLQADILSPWTIGRYNSPRSAEEHCKNRLTPDLAWCREHRKEYLTVVFPGFSWHNMNPDKPLNQIPRLKGEFFWKQCVAAKKAGGAMLYVAMFDELDEGTAIFKCAETPPAGASPFLTLEGLPSDHYLWLAGEAGKLLRGEIEPSDEIPPRKPR